MGVCGGLASEAGTVRETGTGLNGICPTTHRLDLRNNEKEGIFMLNVPSKRG
jgi:hypothetical protein